MTVEEWVAHYEDPKNLRLVIDGQEFPLRHHQIQALQALRFGRKSDSVVLDQHGLLWYRPVVTRRMLAAKKVVHALPIVLKGSVSGEKDSESGSTQ